jgi:hypothetical protein
MSLRPKIGELLVAAEVIEQAVLDQALEKQASSGGRIGKILVAMGAIDEEMLVRTVARQLDLPVVRLRGKQVKPDVLRRLPGHVARTHRCVPVLLDKRGGDTLMIAMEDPSDGVALDQIAIAAGLPVRVVLTGPSDLDGALQRYYPEGGGDEAQRAAPATKSEPAPPDPEPDDDEPVELLLEDAVGESAPPPPPIAPPPAAPPAPDPERTHYAASELARGGGELGSDLDLAPPVERSEPESIFGPQGELGGSGEDRLETGGAVWEQHLADVDISGNDLDPGGDIDEGPDPADSAFEIDPNDLSGRDGGIDLMAADSLDEAIEEVRGTASPSSDSRSGSATEPEDPDEATGAVSRSDALPRDVELRALAELLIERGLLDADELARKLRAARSGGAN